MNPGQQDHEHEQGSEHAQGRGWMPLTLWPADAASTDPTSPGLSAAVALVKPPN